MEAATNGGVSAELAELALPTEDEQRRAAALAELAELNLSALEVAQQAGQRMQRRAELPRTFSVSWLGRTARCMLSARFQKEYDRSGPEAILGSVIHECLATLDMYAQMHKRTQLGQPEAMTIAERVIASGDDRNQPLTWQMYTKAMEMVGRWAVFTTFPDAYNVWQVEMPLRREVSGVPITGRLDKVIIRGTHAIVTDYKTGTFLPNEDEVAKRTQLPLYCWHLAHLYPWVQTFECEEVYLRYSAYRPVWLSREAALRLEDYLTAQVARVRKAYADDDFTPMPGSWCSTCAGKQLCPKPKEARPEAITNDDEAVQAAGRMLVLRQQAKVEEDALRAYLDDHVSGKVLVGDQLVGFHEKTSRRKDYKAIEAALAEGGHTLDEFVDEDTGSEFGKRRAAD